MVTFLGIVLFSAYVLAIEYGVSLLDNRDVKMAKRGKIILWACLGLPLVLAITACIAFILFFMTCFGLIKL